MKTLEIYKNFGDKEGSARCYCSIGSVYLALGNYPEALNYYQKSLKTAEELQNKKGMLVCYTNIGNVHFDQSSYQRDKLGEQNFILEKQKIEITDSINYAQRIQQVMLPDLDKCFITHIRDETFIDHFVLFKPRDIVSGDFYWATTVYSRDERQFVSTITVVAVADCNGHGVPGAFMSMLGISFLNEIVRKKRNNPGKPGA